MARIHVAALLGMVLVGLFLTACDAVNVGTLISSVNPTATASKTARPTFTPPPTFTPTESATVTPAPTDTPIASPTPTKKPAATTAARPAATKAPVPTSAPPPPSFPIILSDSTFCPQPASAPYWKLTARFNPMGTSEWLGGYVIGVFGSDGKFLKAAQPSMENDFTETFNGNCGVYNRYRSNAEIDVTEFRGVLPIIIRVVKSSTDLTPLSADFKATFPSPGNYYLQYNRR